jgi:hypothetical protein
MIYGVGDRVIIGPTASTAEIAGPLKYDPPPVGIVEGVDYEKGIDAFFHQVLESCARARDGEVLGELVRQLSVERSDVEIAAWRRLEACLSYDPDEAPAALVEAMSGLETQIGEDAVEEAAIAAPGPDSFSKLESALEASRASTVVINVDVAERVAQGRRLRRVQLSPWQLAEDSARLVREAIGRPEGPIRGRAFAEMLHADWADLKDARATAQGLPYGARLQLKGLTERVALQRVKGFDRRFELARLLGDAVWDVEAPFGVVSRAKTDRQKFQRAFAQSFLCPFYDLRRHIDIDAVTEEQIAEAARHYHVNQAVIRTLLVNKNVLPRETLAERLDAA